MVLESRRANAFPGKRDDAYRAGITPRIFDGTRDLTIPAKPVFGTSNRPADLTHWRGACCAMLHSRRGAHTMPSRYVFTLLAAVTMGVLAANPQGLPAQNSARDIGAAPQSAVPSAPSGDPALISGDASIVPRTKPAEEAVPLPKAN